MLWSASYVDIFMTSMDPMVPFKETRSHGRVGFSMGAHSLVGFGFGFGAEL